MGKGFRSALFTSVNIAAFAPMPRLSVRTATIVNPGAANSLRNECRTSRYNWSMCRSVSMWIAMAHQHNRCQHQNLRDVFKFQVSSFGVTPTLAFNLSEVAKFVTNGASEE